MITRTKQKNHKFGYINCVAKTLFFCYGSAKYLHSDYKQFGIYHRRAKHVYKVVGTTTTNKDEIYLNKHN